MVAKQGRGALQDVISVGRTTVPMVQVVSVSAVAMVSPGQAHVEEDYNMDSNSDS